MAIETHYDTIVIGGGPAGLSAALWCADLGLKVVVLEGEKEFGGQLLRIFNRIQNYPGIEDTSGNELRDRMLGQVQKLRVELRAGISIANIDLSARLIRLEDDAVLNSRSIIIATGVRRRKLGVSGEDEFGGRGILGSGVNNRESVKGKRVVIIGGGDAALENAIILGNVAESVTVVHRGEQFRARREFVAQAETMKNVAFLGGHVVEKIIGNNNVTGVEIRRFGSLRTSFLPADAVLIRIGVVPNSHLFTDQLLLASGGYIEVDTTCRTNIERVYAVGDVADPVSPTIVTAAGMGAAAAKAAYSAISSDR